MSNVITNIDSLSAGEDEVLYDVNVTTDSLEHLDALDVEIASNASTTYLSFDPIETAKLRPYFDAYATAPSGMYQGQSFMATSHSVEKLSQFVGWLIGKHDEDIKILYMVQKYETPQYIHTNLPPVQYSVRYAIIKR